MPSFLKSRPCKSAATSALLGIGSPLWTVSGPDARVWAWLIAAAALAAFLRSSTWRRLMPGQVVGVADGGGAGVAVAGSSVGWVAIWGVSADGGVACAPAGWSAG